MEKSIWKFPLVVTDEQIVPLPIGAEVLSVQVQNGVPCLWAKVDTDAVKEGRVVQIFGTGHDASDAGDYISTFQLHDGELVFHAFMKN